MLLKRCFVIASKLKSRSSLRYFTIDSNGANVSLKIERGTLISLVFCSLAISLSLRLYFCLRKSTNSLNNSSLFRLLTFIPDF